MKPRNSRYAYHSWSQYWRVVQRHGGIVAHFKLMRRFKAATRSVHK